MCLVGVLLYCALYIALSRSSQRTLNAVGEQGFFYVPVNLETMATNHMAQVFHRFASFVFYPVWLIDRSLGGPSVAGIPLNEISGKP